MGEKNWENAIEWIYGQASATVSFSSPRHISRIKKLAEKYDDVEICKENADGSICAHVPVSWIKINPPKSLSDEQRERLAERARKSFGKGKRK